MGDTTKTRERFGEIKRDGGEIENGPVQEQEQKWERKAVGDREKHPIKQWHLFYIITYVYVHACMSIVCQRFLLKLHFLLSPRFYTLKMNLLHCGVDHKMVDMGYKGLLKKML